MNFAIVSRGVAARPQQARAGPAPQAAPSARRAAPRRRHIARADPVDDVAAKAKSAASDAQDAAKGAAKDVEGAAKSTAEDVKGAAKEAQGAAEGTAGDVKGAAKEAADNNPSATQQTQATQAAESPVKTPSDVAEAQGESPGGVLGEGFVKNWPPKPITDVGAPPPETDPANFDASGNRVKGPSDAEVAKKQAELDEKNPFSKGREGGTQVGGGGEGSSS